MSLILVLILLAVSLVLIGIGLIFSLGSEGDTTDNISKITKSGQYSIVKESPRKKLALTKPSPEQIQEWLKTQSDLSPERIEELLHQWENQIAHIIQIIERGDQEGVEIYGYEIRTSDPQICSFIGDSTYVTREQIFNHPELLPPFYLGDTTSMVPKEAWFGDEKADWVSLLPVQGKYQVPDWRYFEDS